MDTHKTQIKADLVDLQSKADGLKGRMSSLQQELDEVESMINGLQLYLKTRLPKAAKSGGSPISGVDHIANILRRAGEPLHYKEILKRLETEEKAPLRGKKPTSNMTGTLSAGPRFKKMGDGYWGLTEWKEEKAPEKENASGRGA